MNHFNATIADQQDDAFLTSLPGSVTGKDYCSTWLSMQCEMITNVKGAVVLLGPPDQGPYGSAAAWPDGYSSQSLTAAAEQALQERAPLIIGRRAPSEGSGSSLDGYDLAYPIVMAGRLYGVVALNVLPRPSFQLQVVLQQVSWGAAWLEVLLLRQDATDKENQNERLQAVLDASATTLEHESFDEAATAVVTHLAAHLACERVSLGFVENESVSLKTISHSARFGKRANLSRAIEGAMDEALDQEALIVYPPTSGTSYQITRRHHDLVRQHGTGAVCSVPLGKEGQIFGVITFERLADHPFDTSTVEICEAVASLIGPVLNLKFREDRPLTSRAMEALRQWFAVLTGPRHLAPKLASALLAIAIAFFSLVKGEYRVAAKTLIEAQTQRVAVAPFNGFIKHARVRAGDLVRAGEILATLDDRDLKLEQLKWISQKEQHGKQYDLAMAQRNAAQAKIAAAQIAQANAELALVEDQLARTQVRSPLDGVVVSGDLSQSIGAPTERGQVFFEVAPLDAYRIILQVDEAEAAEVAVGQRGNIVLSAFPERSFPFMVEKITPVSAAREGRNYFRVEARMEHAPSQLRPGMEGVGKIHIAERRWIWILTHRGVDWLRMFLWSYLP